MLVVGVECNVLARFDVQSVHVSARVPVHQNVRAGIDDLAWDFDFSTTSTLLIMSP